MGIPSFGYNNYVFLTTARYLWRYTNSARKGIGLRRDRGTMVICAATAQLRSSEPLNQRAIFPKQNLEHGQAFHLYEPLPRSTYLPLSTLSDTVILSLCIGSHLLTLSSRMLSGQFEFLTNCVGAMSNEESRGTWRLLARNDQYRFTGTNLLSMENESLHRTDLCWRFFH